MFDSQGLQPPGRPRKAGAGQVDASALAEGEPAARVTNYTFDCFLLLKTCNLIMN